MTFIKKLSCTLQNAFLISTGIVTFVTAGLIGTSLLSSFFGLLFDTDNTTDTAVSDYFC